MVISKDLTEEGLVLKLTHFDKSQHSSFKKIYLYFMCMVLFAYMPLVIVSGSPEAVWVLVTKPKE